MSQDGSFSTKLTQQMSNHESRQDMHSGANRTDGDVLAARLILLIGTRSTAG